MAPNPPLQVAEPTAVSTMKMNFLSDLGYDKQGAKIRKVFNSKNAFCASGSSSAPFHSESLSVNFVKAFEIKLKFQTCVPKNFLIQVIILFLLHFWAGQLHGHI